MLTAAEANKLTKEVVSRLTEEELLPPIEALIKAQIARGYSGMHLYLTDYTSDKSSLLRKALEEQGYLVKYIALDLRDILSKPAFYISWGHA